MTLVQLQKFCTFHDSSFAALVNVNSTSKSPKGGVKRGNKFWKVLYTEDKNKIKNKITQGRS
jgi:hypothetical protein